MGVLFRDAKAIELVRQVDTLVVDKMEIAAAAMSLSSLSLVGNALQLRSALA